MTAVYRGYDQPALDAQYNLRARWPEHREFFRTWAERGDRARAQPGWRTDLAYGPTDMERLDLLVPEAAAAHIRRPVLAFIHGGYWQALDKRDCDWMGSAFARRGIAFASLNYALAPAVGLDEIVRQMRAAVAWLWRFAPALGLDPTRIFVGGHSAGGHLAAMAAATDWTRHGGLPGDLVKGVVSVSGVYDLEPVSLTYHQPVLKLTRAAIDRLSPTRHRLRFAGPVLLTVGGDETEEFRRQQREFALAWRGFGVDVREVAAPDLHHFDILESVADDRHDIFRAIATMIAPGSA